MLVLQRDLKSPSSSLKRSPPEGPTVPSTISKALLPHLAVPISFRDISWESTSKKSIYVCKRVPVATGAISVTSITCHSGTCCYSPTDRPPRLKSRNCANDERVETLQHVRSSTYSSIPSCSVESERRHFLERRTRVLHLHHRSS